MTADTAVNDILEPCYFAAEQRLFGCWHPGHGRRAAIVCMPIGHEYLRMHRAGRQLAVQLSRAGIHALRSQRNRREPDVIPLLRKLTALLRRETRHSVRLFGLFGPAGRAHA